MSPTKRSNGYPLPRDFAHLKKASMDSVTPHPPQTPEQFQELLALLAQGRLVVAPTVPQVQPQEGKA